VLVVAGAVMLAAALRAPEKRPDFVFVNRGDVTTLDLAQMSWRQDFRVARMIYEGLTRNDVFTWNYETRPGVAERWEVSPDGLVYTFFLRADAKWSNGEPVRAQDFVYSWRRVLLPDLAGDYIKLGAVIEGADAFTKWRAEELAKFAADRTITDRRRAAEELWRRTEERFAATVGVEALGERTLRVTLERPTPYFLDLTSFSVFYPVYPPLVRAHTTIDDATGLLKTNPDWTRPERLIGNGAFTLERWRFKRDMRFAKNEHYWDRANIALDTVGVASIQDPNAQVLAFTTGAVDWLTDVTPSYRADIVRDKQRFYAEHAAEVASLRAQGLDPVEIDRRLPSDPRNRILVLPAFGTYFYNFNCRPRMPDGRPNPFADARVRRAFALAVDKQAIVEHVRRVGEPTTATLIPRGALAGYKSPAGLTRNPDESRRLLAEAGYPRGEGLPTIEILFNKEGEHELIAQSVAKDWERELGVRVALRTKEIKVFREDLKNGDFMVSRGSWFGDYGDPTTFLDLSASDNGNNDRKYASAEFDALLARAADEADAAKRLDILAEAERMIVERDFPLLPMFHYADLYMIDPHRVTGVSSHARQEQNVYLFDVLGDGKGADEPKVMRRGDPSKGNFKLQIAPGTDGAGGAS